MRNPIAFPGRIVGMGVVRLLLAALAVSLLAGAGTARADNPALTGDVGRGDAFVISLTDATGATVTHLDAGTYTLNVHDRSSFHNFHLSGPGVDASTDVDFVGDKTFTITLVDGTYFFDCDPHSSQMKGSFTVGAVTTPPPPVKLAASLSAVSKSTLGPLAGVSAGKYRITVRDRSAKDGFRLVGPGVTRSTGVKFTGTASWAVTLQAGTYSFGSSRLPKLRHRFTVSG